MSMTKKQYLKEMEIDVWQSKDKIDLATKQSTNAQIFCNLTEFEKQVLNCTLCELHKTRKHVVFGAGSQNASVMFIGEAPGANEDLQGKPFVGRAGMLLNSMLQAIGFQRDDVYIANILKCRPPNNRDPQPREVQVCSPYLQKQIAIIKPKVLVAL